MIWSSLPSPYLWISMYTRTLFICWFALLSSMLTIVFLLMMWKKWCCLWSNSTTLLSFTLLNLIRLGVFSILLLHWNRRSARFYNGHSFSPFTSWTNCFICHIVQSLKREKVVRIFKLNTGQDDHAIMFTDDYISQVGSIYIRKPSESWFCPAVLYSAVVHMQLIILVLVFCIHSLFFLKLVSWVAY